MQQPPGASVTCALSLSLRWLERSRQKGFLKASQSAASVFMTLMFTVAAQGASGSVPEDGEQRWGPKAQASHSCPGQTGTEKNHLEAGMPDLGL